MRTTTIMRTTTSNCNKALPLSSTPSDHIPIIATITTNPIQIQNTPRLSFHIADCPEYNRILETVQVIVAINRTIEQINTHGPLAQRTLALAEK